MKKHKLTRLQWSLSVPNYGAVRTNLEKPIACLKQNIQIKASIEIDRKIRGHIIFLPLSKIAEWILFHKQKDLKTTIFSDCITS